MQDKALLARARAKYELGVDLHEQMSAHRQVRPKPLPDSWQPSTHQKRLLVGAVPCLLAAIVVMLLVGGLWWVSCSSAWG